MAEKVYFAVRPVNCLSSVTICKPSAYRRQNKLYFALCEIGRIERTLFTLDWLGQTDFCRASQAGLNEGEARHALADAILTNRKRVHYRLDG
ncbi:Tn3 family transposase [Sphingopyxis granuli]|nr:Tn3 family transposase [Sphingopyxis granuli]QUM71010.1 Tn3 family transposase [Sphingopyxis granuli]